MTVEIWGPVTMAPSIDNTFMLAGQIGGWGWGGGGG